MIRCVKLPSITLVLALASCGTLDASRDMVGYVPPTSLPAQPRRTVVQDDFSQVWAGLASYLQESAFDIDHQDFDKKLIVARYSGNPEPYVDCGSIVVHENGTLRQIAAAIESISLNHEMNNQHVLLNRLLNLDSRIIIRLEERQLGTVVSTDTTYVVTKIVDIETRSGSEAEGSRETVSFNAGERASFGRGTACQPNGSLDLAILQGLSNVVGSTEITRAALPVQVSARNLILEDGLTQRSPGKRNGFKEKGKHESASPLSFGLSAILATKLAHQTARQDY